MVLKTTVDIEDALKNHLSKFDSAPFLFIGSGFSRRYIDLENWEGLLELFSHKLSKDFDYYAGKYNKNWPKVATAMSKEFYEIWWSDPEYKNSRNEFKNQIKNLSSPLKIEISQYLKNKKYVSNVNIQLDAEIDSLKKVVIDGIITTNWDMLLEQIFKEEISATYVGQEELLFSNPKEISEIYKIHGSSSNPDTLVLTEDDYSNFRDKNPYLAAKLLTIFIEHPIIFIGYSMSDENIQDILRSITNCLTVENLDKLKDRLIFVHRDSNNEGDSFKSSPIFINDITINTTNITTNDYTKVYDALGSVKRKLPSKILRQLKSQIYELIRTNDPNEKIYAALDFEKEYDTKDIEFVFGVGISKEFAEKGYKTFSIEELFAGIVTYKDDSKEYDFDKIVTQTLPGALRIDNLLPIFKYCALSKIPYEELIKNERIKKSLSLNLDILLSKSQKGMQEYIYQNFNTIQELEASYPYYDYKLFDRIMLLKEVNIDFKYLESLIFKNLSYLNEDSSVTKTSFRKLIRFYDLMIYKKMLINPTSI